MLPQLQLPEIDLLSPILKTRRGISSLDIDSLDDESCASAGDGDDEESNALPRRISRKRHKISVLSFWVALVCAGTPPVFKHAHHFLLPGDTLAHTSLQMSDTLQAARDVMQRLRSWFFVP